MFCDVFSNTQLWVWPTDCEMRVLCKNETNILSPILFVPSLYMTILNLKDISIVHTE